MIKDTYYCDTCHIKLRFIPPVPAASTYVKRGIRKLGWNETGETRKGHWLTNRGWCSIFGKCRFMDGEWYWYIPIEELQLTYEEREHENERTKLA